MFSKIAFGLDISDHSIEILELFSKSKIKIFGRIVLEPDIIKGGLILDKKKLIKKLEELLAKTKVKSSQVILSLPESKVFIHIFQVKKNLKGKKLKERIASEAIKVIPLEPENIYWDCQVISSNSKQNQDVLYVATFKNIIDGYLEVLSQVGLRAVVVEIESIALARALLEDLKTDNAVMIVDLGARTTNISIFNRRRELKWSSTKLIGGNNFTQAIVEKLKIPFEEAENFKKQGWEEKKIGEILQKEFEEIIEEIENILNYYPDPIEEIILTGGSSLIPNLDFYLSSTLKKKVSLGKSPIAKQLKQDSSLYNTVIGLALKGLNKKVKKWEINLLPDRIRTKSSFVNYQFEKSKLFQIFGYVFPLLSLAFLGWIIMNYAPKTYKIVSSKKILENFTFAEKKLIQPNLIEEKVKIIEKNEKIPEEKITEVESQLTVEEKPVEQSINQLLIKENIGVLNVRSGPGISYSIITKVYPGQIYEFSEEKENWFKIKIDDEIEGWVSASYVFKK